MNVANELWSNKVCTVIAVDSWPVWGVMAGVMAFRMTGIAPAAAMAAATWVSWLALAAYIAMLAKTSQPTSFITAALRTHGCGYRVRSLEILNVVNKV